MEIKTNMASYIEQADLCTCVTGNMMYDKRRDGRPAGCTPRPAISGQGILLCILHRLFNSRLIKKHVTHKRAMLQIFLLFICGLINVGNCLQSFRNKVLRPN